MSKEVCEKCKKYYPRLWDDARLKVLLAKKKLTQAEYDEIISGE